METILFIATLTCSLVIACNLCVFDLSDTFSLEIFVAIFDLYAILLNFAYFYLAERISTDSLEIGDFFYNSPWYQLPAKHQSLLVLPIQRARRELRLSGLGIFECSLMTFSAV